MGTNICMLFFPHVLLFLFEKKNKRILRIMKQKKITKTQKEDIHLFNFTMLKAK